jgi:hypothetical protein
MSRIETNDFAISNLAELTSRYRLFRIRGIRRDHSQYYTILGRVVRRLSYLLRKPVTVIERDEIPHLVVREDAGAALTPLSLGQTVYFDQIGDVFNLDYTVRTPENDEICLRFLQFMIQEQLYGRSDLWQPRSGSAFFEREPVSTGNGVGHYIGHAVRVVAAPRGGLAIRIHLASKYIGLDPLPAIVARANLHDHLGRSYVYHFGYRWYEIWPKSLDDLTVMEYTVPDGNGGVPLLEYVVARSKKPIPMELAEVPVEGSVVHYLDNRGNEMGVPAALCYPVFSAKDYRMDRFRGSSLLPPTKRRDGAVEFAQRCLRRLRFGSTELRISASPLDTRPRMFLMPDFVMGHSTILSVRNTKGAVQTSLESLGRMRLALLRDPKVGFYETDALDRQYLIMPQSVMDSYGQRFVGDLKVAVDAWFPQEYGYDPIVVTYNDRVKRTLAHQGNAILAAVRSACKLPGYAVVMVHEIARRKPNAEDELAGMVRIKLREHEIIASVIHSTVAQRSYQAISGRTSQPEYVPLRGKQGSTLRGYLQNVALNKVLLNNQRWPFVLGTRLHADIVVGIDVKGNTAGLVVVGRNGMKLRAVHHTSSQREQLTTGQLEKWLRDILFEEARTRTDPIRTIVVHRDGRVWPAEIKGAQNAVDYLRRMGWIDSDASLTVLEIVKNPQAPLRLFSVSQPDGSASNPQVGFYRIVTDSEGYVCTTGRPFRRPGTAEPLCVRRAAGDMPIQHCLEDVYYLSALALTKPDDCSRYPITIKLNDRMLVDVATAYDEDEVEYGDTSQGKEGEEHESDRDSIRDVRGTA